MWVVVAFVGVYRMFWMIVWSMSTVGWSWGPFASSSTWPVTCQKFKRMSMTGSRVSLVLLTCSSLPCWSVMQCGLTNSFWWKTILIPFFHLSNIFVIIFGVKMFPFLNFHWKFLTIHRNDVRMIYSIKCDMHCLECRKSIHEKELLKGLFFISIWKCFNNERMWIMALSKTLLYSEVGILKHVGWFTWPFIAMSLHMVITRRCT